MNPNEPQQPNDQPQVSSAVNNFSTPPDGSAPSPTPANPMPAQPQATTPAEPTSDAQAPVGAPVLTPGNAVQKSKLPLVLIGVGVVLIIAIIVLVIL